MRDLRSQLAAAWARRRVALDASDREAFRLVNDAGDGFDGLFADYYHGRLLLTAESARWLEHRPSLEAALRELGSESARDPEIKFFWVENLPGRRAPAAGPEPETFTVREGDASFEVRLGAGPHTGLFLDQRENRRELRRLASGRRFLNLFCHTGAFTVAALQGGASEAVSVDLSKNYLAWLERNLALNALPRERSRTVAGDAVQYLAAAGKRRERFDLILLDPPTFGRSKGGAFSTLRDYGTLLEACGALLSPHGRLLACLNTRKTPAAEFRALLAAAAKEWGRKLLAPGAMPQDFPAPAGSDNPCGLKSYWLG